MSCRHQRDGDTGASRLVGTDAGKRLTVKDHAGARRFRRGEAGAWRDELTIQQVARIEAAQGPMMHRLGYELTVARESADA